MLERQIKINNSEIQINNLEKQVSLSDSDELILNKYYYAHRKMSPFYKKLFELPKNYSREVLISATIVVQTWWRRVKYRNKRNYKTILESSKIFKYNCNNIGKVTLNYHVFPLGRIM